FRTGILAVRHPDGRLYKTGRVQRGPVALPRPLPEIAVESPEASAGMPLPPEPETAHAAPAGAGIPGLGALPAEGVLPAAGEGVLPPGGTAGDGEPWPAAGAVPSAAAPPEPESSDAILDAIIAGMEPAGEVSLDGLHIAEEHEPDAPGADAAAPEAASGAGDASDAEAAVGAGDASDAEAASGAGDASDAEAASDAEDVLPVEVVALEEPPAEHGPAPVPTAAAVLASLETDGGLMALEDIVVEDGEEAAPAVSPGPPPPFAGASPGDAAGAGAPSPDEADLVSLEDIAVEDEPGPPPAPLPADAFPDGRPRAVAAAGAGGGPSAEDADLVPLEDVAVEYEPGPPPAPIPADAFPEGRPRAVAAAGAGGGPSAEDADLVPLEDVAVEDAVPLPAGPPSSAPATHVAGAGPGAGDLPLEDLPLEDLPLEEVLLDGGEEDGSGPQPDGAPARDPDSLVPVEEIDVADDILDGLGLPDASAAGDGYEVDISELDDAEPLTGPSTAGASISSGHVPSFRERPSASPLAAAPGVPARAPGASAEDAWASAPAGLTDQDRRRISELFPGGIRKVLPLTPFQTGLLSSPGGMEGAVCQLRTRLAAAGGAKVPGRAVISGALEALLAAQPELSASYVFEGLSRPVRVWPARGPGSAGVLGVMDLSSEPAGAAEKRARGVMKAQAEALSLPGRPGKIAVDSLVLPGGETELILSAHMGAVDRAQALAILAGLASGKPPALPPPPESRAPMAARAEMDAAWEALLREAGEPTELPKRVARCPDRDVRSRRAVPVRFKDWERDEFLSAAGRMGVDLDAFVTGAWLAFVSRLTGNPCPQCALLGPAPEGGAGGFMRPFPLQAGPDSTLAAAARAAAARIGETGRLGHLSYPEILRLSGWGRAAADHVLAPPPAAPAGGMPRCLAGLSETPPQGLDSFPLSLFWKSEGGLELTIGFSLASFEPWQAEVLAQGYEIFLRAMKDDPDRTVSEVEVLAPEKRKALLSAACPAREIPPGPFTSLFAAAAAADPSAAAVRSGGAAVSYGEAASAAAALASGLRSAGAGPGLRVAVCATRSAGYPISLLAAMMAGSAAVPLSRDMERDALSAALKLAAPACALVPPSCGAFREVLAEALPGVPVLDPDAAGLGGPALEAAPAPDPAVSGAGDALVLAALAPGGVPRLARVTHDGLKNMALSLAREASAGPGDAFSALSDPAGPCGLAGILAPLSCGAACVMPPEDLLPGADGFPDGPSPSARASAFAAESGTTVLALPEAAALDYMASAPLDGLKALCAFGARSLGGASLPPDAVRALMKGSGECRVVYAWGPEESLGFALCETAHPGRLPGTLGGPVANVPVYVLGPDGEPVPSGYPGRLASGRAAAPGGPSGEDGDGAGAALVPAPAAEPGGPTDGWLMLSGVTARRRPDGRFDCLGLDGREGAGVSARLRSAERKLLESPGVLDARVWLVSGRASAAAVMYPALDGPGRAALEKALQRRLAPELPAGTGPARVAAVPEFPLDRSGGVDLVRLAVPPRQAAPLPPQGKSGDPPSAGAPAGGKRPCRRYDPLRYGEPSGSPGPFDPTAYGKSGDPPRGGERASGILPSGSATGAAPSAGAADAGGAPLLSDGSHGQGLLSDGSRWTRTAGTRVAVRRQGTCASAGARIRRPVQERGAAPAPGAPGARSGPGRPGGRAGTSGWTRGSGTASGRSGRGGAGALAAGGDPEVSGGPFDPLRYGKSGDPPIRGAPPGGGALEALLAACANAMNVPPELLDPELGFAEQGGDSLSAFFASQRLRECGWSLSGADLLAAMSLAEAAGDAGAADGTPGAAPGGIETAPPDVLAGPGGGPSGIGAGDAGAADGFSPFAAGARAHGFQANHLEDEERVIGALAVTPLSISPLTPAMEASCASWEGGGAVYAQRLLEMAVEADPFAMGDRLELLGARHEILRTALVTRGVARSRLAVLPEMELPLTYTSLIGFSSADRDERVREFRRAVPRPDPARDPPFRVDVFQAEPARALVLLSYLDDLFDQHTVSALAGELVAARPPAGAPRPFSEFLSLLEGRERVADRAFWEGALKGLRSVSSLFVPAAGDPDPELEAPVAFDVDDQVYRRLKTLARVSRVPLQTLVECAFAAALSMFNGEGVQLYARRAPVREMLSANLQNTMGCLLSLAPARCELSGQKTFLECAGALDRFHADAAPHSFAPLWEIRAAAGLDVGDIVFFAEEEARFTQGSMRIREIPLPRPKRREADLVFHLEWSERQARVMIHASPVRFRRSMILDFRDGFAGALSALASSPRLRISDVTLLSGALKERALDAARGRRPAAGSGADGAPGNASGEGGPEGGFGEGRSGGGFGSDSAFGRRAGFGGRFAAGSGLGGEGAPGAEGSAWGEAAAAPEGRGVGGADPDGPADPEDPGDLAPAPDPGAAALERGGVSWSAADVARAVSEGARFLADKASSAGMGAGAGSGGIPSAPARGLRIALLFPYGPFLAVSALAALRAGFAAVPLDPALPPERLRFILGDSSADAVLAASALLPAAEDIAKASASERGLSAQLRAPVWDFERVLSHALGQGTPAGDPGARAPGSPSGGAGPDGPELSAAAGAAPSPGDPSRLAAVLYHTRPAPGVPWSREDTERGGVALSARGCAERMRISREAFGIGAGSRVMAVPGTPSERLFADIVPALRAGGAVAGLPSGEPEKGRDTYPGPEELAAFVRDRAVSFAWLPAVAAKKLLGRSDLGSLRTLAMSGPSPGTLYPGGDGVRAVYAYAPSGFPALWRECGDGPSAPRALPAPGVEAFVVDGRGRILPPGAPGGIALSGEAVGGPAGGGAAGSIFFASPLRRSAPELMRAPDGGWLDEEGCVNVLGAGDASRLPALRGRPFSPEAVERRIFAASFLKNVHAGLWSGEGAPEVALWIKAGFREEDEGEKCRELARLRRSFAASLPAWLIPTRMALVQRIPLENGLAVPDRLPAPDLAPLPSERALEGDPVCLEAAEAVASAWRTFSEADPRPGRSLASQGLDGDMAFLMAKNLKARGFPAEPSDFRAFPSPESLAAELARRVGAAFGAPVQDVPAGAGAPERLDGAYEDMGEIALAGDGGGFGACSGKAAAGIPPPFPGPPAPGPAAPPGAAAAALPASGDGPGVLRGEFSDGEDGEGGDAVRASGDAPGSGVPADPSGGAEGAVPPAGGAVVSASPASGDGAGTVAAHGADGASGEGGDFSGVPEPAGAEGPVSAAAASGAAGAVPGGPLGASEGDVSSNGETGPPLDVTGIVAVAEGSPEEEDVLDISRVVPADESNDLPPDMAITPLDEPVDIVAFEFAGTVGEVGAKASGAAGASGEPAEASGAAGVSGDPAKDPEPTGKPASGVPEGIARSLFDVFDSVAMSFSAVSAKVGNKASAAGDEDGSAGAPASDAPERKIPGVSGESAAKSSETPGPASDADGRTAPGARAVTDSRGDAVSPADPELRPASADDDGTPRADAALGDAGISSGTATEPESVPAPAAVTEETAVPAGAPAVSRESPGHPPAQAAPPRLRASGDEVTAVPQPSAAAAPEPEPTEVPAAAVPEPEPTEASAASAPEPEPMEASAAAVPEPEPTEASAAEAPDPELAAVPVPERPVDADRSPVSASSDAGGLPPVGEAPAAPAPLPETAAPAATPAGPRPSDSGPAVPRSGPAPPFQMPAKVLAAARSVPPVPVDLGKAASGPGTVSGSADAAPPSAAGAGEEDPAAAAELARARALSALSEYVDVQKVESLVPLGPFQQALAAQAATQAGPMGLVGMKSWTLEAPLAPDALEAAFTGIVRETPRLRSVFTPAPGVMRAVLSEAPRAFSASDLKPLGKGAPEAAREAAMQVAMSLWGGAGAPALHRGPLLRLMCFRLDEGVYRLTLVYALPALSPPEATGLLEAVAARAATGRGSFEPFPDPPVPPAAPERDPPRKELHPAFRGLEGLAPANLPKSPESFGFEGNWALVRRSLTAWRGCPFPLKADYGRDDAAESPLLEVDLAVDGKTEQAIYRAARAHGTGVKCFLASVWLMYLSLYFDVPQAGTGYLDGDPGPPDADRRREADDADGFAAGEALAARGPSRAGAGAPGPAAPPGLPARSGPSGRSGRGPVPGVPVMMPLVVDLPDSATVSWAVKSCGERLAVLNGAALTESFPGWGRVMKILGVDGPAQSRFTSAVVFDQCGPAPAAEGFRTRAWTGALYPGPSVSLHVETSPAPGMRTAGRQPGIRGRVVVDRALLGPELAHAVRTGFLSVLAQAAESPSRKLCDLTLLAAGDLARISKLARGAELPARPRESLGYMIRRRLEDAPGAPALSSPDGRLDAGGLLARVREVTEFSGGMGADLLGAVVMPMGADFVVAALSLVMSGAAVSPMDPEWVRLRLRGTLADADPDLVMVSAETGPMAGDHPAPRLVFRAGGQLSPMPGLRPTRPPLPPGTGAVLYSGGSGPPMGAAVQHAAVSARARQIRDAWKISQKDKVALLTGSAAPEALGVVFAALLSGAELCLPPSWARDSAQAFLDYARREGVTVAFVPALLSRGIQSGEAPRTLRACVAVGGRVSFYRPQPYAFWADWGPRETLGAGLRRRLDRQEAVHPLGWPSPGTEAAVISRAGTARPLGLAGEIAIGGSFVARGYLNRPEESARRFCRDPRAPGGPADTRLFFRTGLRGEADQDGHVYPKGRLGEILNVLGLEPELQESERAVKVYPGVCDARVLPFRDAKG
ncbi:MAG: AMP-binding protein, partial [Deltaproteobacteria bacterium]|nr:AMP-binding protein [Deltaproteobacteria bacterium]